MRSGAHKDRIEILLVEDNPDDAELTLEAFQSSHAQNRLHVVEDGVEALAFLRRQGRYAEAPRPHLILLDLNLPRKSGHEVLAEIKADPDLRVIPVVILSTSTADQDIAASYRLAANCYITKPVDIDGLYGVVRQIDDFWLETVRLPSAHR